MGEKGRKMAEAHADFIKRWYQEVFEHGYKHGYEDGSQELKKPRPEADPSDGHDHLIGARQPEVEKP